ncbi:MAG: hypothetical protein J6Y07_01230 [Alphaproteobacteria bacterium]|nr:hypothetical protein [Alphaproteobacteria bacterium]
MKGYLSVFALLGFVGVSAFAATNSGMGGASVANLDTTTPAVRSNPANVNYQKYETRSTTRTYATPVRQSNVGYTTTSNYYTPANRTQMYYNSGASSSTYNRSSTVRTQVKRKYYLAHPFFQPTEGKFGMITDISYNTSSYDVDFDPTYLSDPKAKWSARGFAIKEDLSYGITDRFGVLLMGRYDSTKYKFDWSTAPDDVMKDNGLNIYGAGLQWRFVDNEKWIATLSGYYERQQDVANEFVLDLKGGYKIAKSTIYGLGRGWLVSFDDKYYGNGMSGMTESGIAESLFIAYNGDTQTTLFVEGGLGVFSVLGEDWTLNLEAIYGYYDWHGQAYVKAAIGWQPNDWFALNLYGKTSFYDTADGQHLDAYMTDGGVWESIGKAKIDGYNEMSFGGQVIFYF